MIDPYLLLNIAPDADDAMVKSAYLNAIRLYPPEQHPDVFEAVRAAFESIATERQRVQQQLFNLTPINLTTLMYPALESNISCSFSEEIGRDLLKKAAHVLIEKNLETV